MIKSKRDRGRILTATGLKKLNEAIQEWSDRYNIRGTLTEIEAECGVGSDTVSKIRQGREGADLSKIRQLFAAFDLTLTNIDHRSAKLDDAEDMDEPSDLLPTEETADRNRSVNIFISYQSTEPDRELGKQLEIALSAIGNTVFTEDLTPNQVLETTSQNVPLAASEPELPGGQVDVASQFYIERHPIEERCYQTILQPSALIRIKAPRQMGKTSLMARILNHASCQDYHTVPLTFQLVDKTIFANLDKFLKWFCAYVGRELNIPNQLDDYWDEIFGSKVNCKDYFEKHLLPQIDTPLVLGLDEIDRVFQYPDIAEDFLGLLRAWHEESKRRDIWKKLRLIIVHSTEVYIPMNINQSPFNVGLPVDLPEFNAVQIQDLAARHNLNWSNLEVEKLMAIVGGHPYLVRVALYHISQSGLTLNELKESAIADSGIYSDHLRRQLWSLEEYPELAAGMREIAAADSPVQLKAMQAFKLDSLGLVKLQGNECVPRCDLYRQYFRSHLSAIG